MVLGYPDRILPVDDKAAAILKERTLTNLYNERPVWLAHAHRDSMQRLRLRMVGNRISQTRKF